ncbi:condensation domain-containing protein [Paenibacillus sp. P25]|nr:condensation domain-containing protein [Paenibacillus sp. P25]
MAFEQEALFWNEKFDGEDALTKLPYNKSPNHAAAKLQTISGALSSDVSQHIIQLSRGSHLAAYMILLSGIQCLLYKYTNERPILLGMPAVSKSNESAGLINPVVLLKNRISPDQSFKHLLNQVKLTLTEAIRHQNIPFRKMTERLAASIYRWGACCQHPRFFEGDSFGGCQPACDDGSFCAICLRERFGSLPGRL